MVRVGDESGVRAHDAAPADRFAALMDRLAPIRPPAQPDPAEACGGPSTAACGSRSRTPRLLPLWVAASAPLRAAIRHACTVHAGQVRPGDGAPFITHPLEVASLLADAGGDEDMIVAGILHDTVEEGGPGIVDLTVRYGPSVAGLVAALTQPAVPGYANRKAALRDQIERAGPRAAIVFAADKLSSVRELQHPAASALTPVKLAHYRRSLDMLERTIPAHHLVRQIRAELGALPDLGRPSDASLRVQPSEVPRRRERSGDSPDRHRPGPSEPRPLRVVDDALVL